MIFYIDPVTSEVCLCSDPSSVPYGVDWREVPHAVIEHRDELIDFDVDGLPVYDTSAINRKLIMAEAVRRINYQFNAIQNLDDVKFFVELWRSIVPTARQPTTALSEAINVYQTALDAVNNNTPYDQVVWP